MRIDKNTLLDQISAWNSVVPGKIRLIACGGTAMTLIGAKESTKDIDLMIPEENEYKKLISTLEKIGYKNVTGNGWSKDNEVVFDIYCGNKIHTTELVHSPLEPGRSLMLKKYSKISIGILNYYDLIISKLFRGTSIDYDDCESLAEKKKDEIDFNRLEKEFIEVAKGDISEEKVLKHFDKFKKTLKQRGITNNGF